MRDKWKMALEPFAHSCAGMYEAMRNLSDEDLQELQDACTKVTQTNCWCFIYQAANLMREQVESEIRIRANVNGASADATPSDR